MTNKTLQQQAMTTNVPISQPILYPDHELVNMNGFAFTHRNGIVLCARSTAQDLFQFMGNVPDVSGGATSASSTDTTSVQPTPPRPTTDNHYDYHAPYDQPSSYDGPVNI